MRLTMKWTAFKGAVDNLALLFGAGEGVCQESGLRSSNRHWPIVSAVEAALARSGKSVPWMVPVQLNLVRHGEQRPPARAPTLSVETRNSRDEGRLLFTTARSSLPFRFSILPQVAVAVAPNGLFYSLLSFVNST